MLKPGKLYRVLEARALWPNECKAISELCHMPLASIFMLIEYYQQSSTGVDKTYPFARILYKNYIGIIWFPKLEEVNYE